ncbi:MAG TPA: ribosome-associated translation inhibitor RaiA [Bacillota bacterium]|jgi:putative sigma-54 modulation protein|nr:ribosome-associated translation inhibitor RaiA [Bacillota bacterium]HPT66505.1 ribosome-associated translation inhibitor RaiA [Bacillota bacterium]
MQVTIVGKNLEITDALRQYAEKKVAKVEKFFEQAPMEAQVTMGLERGKHIVEVTISVDGLLLRGEEKTGDMYASIDGAVEKIERQIHKYKTRINRKLRGINQVIAVSPQTQEAEPAEPQIVRTKRFAVKPMSVEEAVMQMDLLGHDFYVFANSETDEVNVVYRRKDGNFGLIEPEF